MGIDTSGKMIVGAYIEDCPLLESIEDVGEWADDNGLVITSDYFDAGIEGQKVGFKVENASIGRIDLEWMAQLHEKSEKFEELTGNSPMLLGTQDVW